MVNPISFPAPQAWSAGADFTPLANLGEVYKKAQNESRLSELGKQLADGSITYQQAAGQVADMGDINSTLKFLALAEQQKQKALETTAAGNFQRTLGGLYGGGGAAATIAAPPSAAPNPAPGLLPNAAADDEVPPPRATPPTRVAAVTPPTDVIRTNPDGTIAGNITSPKEPPPVVAPAPVATAPAAQSFDDRFAAARPAANAATPTAAHIPALLGALSDPNLPAAQKDTAKLLLNKALDDAKVPEKIQTLTALKEQSGFKGTLLDLELKLRNASKTDVNILPGEKKYDEAINKDLAEQHIQLNKDARAASNTKGTLDMMERATKDPNFYSGPLSGLGLAYKRGAATLGLEPSDAATSSEVFQKMSNKLVTDIAGGGGGGLGSGVSNADRDFIANTVPNLQNTPGGNQAIINYMRKAEDRKQEVARMANAYAKNHGGRIDYEFYNDLDKYANEHPLFPQAATPPAGPDRSAIEAEMKRRKLLP
jgi:hypothetical protein